MKQSDCQEMLCRDTNYRKAFRLAVAVPFGVAAFALLAEPVRERISFLVPPCMFETLTGWNCMSCGSTRATLALLHGDLFTAVYYNPLYVVFLCWLVYLYLRLAASLVIRPYRPYRLTVTLPRGLIVGAICLAFTVIRNLPWYRAVFY
jgi:hypothetical protein